MKESFNQNASLPFRTNRTISESICRVNMIIIASTYTSNDPCSLVPLLASGALITHTLGHFQICVNDTSGENILSLTFVKSSFTFTSHLTCQSNVVTHSDIGRMLRWGPRTRGLLIPMFLFFCHKLNCTRWSNVAGILLSIPIFDGGGQHDVAHREECLSFAVDGGVKCWA